MESDKSKALKYMYKAYLNLIGMCCYVSLVVSPYSHDVILETIYTNCNITFVAPDFQMVT